MTRVCDDSSSSEDTTDVDCLARFPLTQKALVLYGFGQQYVLNSQYAVPVVRSSDEMLIKVESIGLNPIDWKAPAFNFGIPNIPWVCGRDLAGTVIAESPCSSRLRIGDRVLVPSTDYRDIRKAAFQEYAIATYYNAARIPPENSTQQGAAVGVAFVAASLALGVSFGLDFSVAAKSPGPNLIDIISNVLCGSGITADIRNECNSSRGGDRIRTGDWLVIWGASTTTGFIALQLAKLCGLKVICVADIARHGTKLLDVADLLVDRLDPDRAVEIIRGVAQGKLRFGLDFVGSETALFLQRALCSNDKSKADAHLLGISGLPKIQSPKVRYHHVPIKLFHTSPVVGERLVLWLEDLLQRKALVLPELVVRKGGLADVNNSLTILRNGLVSGKRVVIDLQRCQSQ